MRVVRTRLGARIVHGDAVLSEIRSRPGPTHTLLDVVAACAATFGGGARTALLGFAGGGVIAPLRALGFAGEVHAVDLSRGGERVFRELSRSWSGTVRLDLEEASAWLRGRRTRYDAVIEDLSIVDRDGTTSKPDVSWSVLPALIRRRLRVRGVAITNVLRPTGTTWAAAIETLAAPHRDALVVHLDDYENRIVVAGTTLPPAREASRQLRDALARIGSRQARRVAVRSR